MTRVKMNPSDFNDFEETKWEIWYHDNFDHDTPREKELAGTGLIQGLGNLWAQHLYETINSGGFIGFSRFNLWLNQQKVSIVIKGDLEGQGKLRQWVFEGRSAKHATPMQIADEAILNLIVQFHITLGLNDQSSARIIEMACSASGRDEFMRDIEASLIQHQDFVIYRGVNRITLVWNGLDSLCYPVGSNKQ